MVIVNEKEIKKMWWYVKEDIKNWIICWLIKRTHCYATVFYTLCKQLSPMEIEVYTNSYLKYQKEKEND
jgi:hypothetical protein